MCYNVIGDNMTSAYIHIPFCNKLCSYCDFCKMNYKKEWVDEYLKSLEKEIKKTYNGEELNTIYIGGGTPSTLNIEELTELFRIIKVLKKNKSIEFTIECNSESLTREKIDLFVLNGINRVSLGVETFNAKYLKLLNREPLNIEIFNYLKSKITNINVDLMYAFPLETKEELIDDIKKIKNLNVPHISTYSLIIEENTKLYIEKTKNIDEDLDYEMYNIIIKELDLYNHYEISNFSKKKYESRHNLVYWNNLEYYGFGLGASGYVNNIRYDNTRSLNEYLKGNYVLNKETLTKETKMENEFILGFRKINGINKMDFKSKYNMNIYDYPKVKELIENKKLIDDSINIKINPKYIYTSNEILINFIN